MNLAFSSLILLIILLPGLIFSASFINTDNKPVTYVPLTHKAILSIFATFILQALWLWLAHMMNYSINIHSVLVIASGISNTEYSKELESITINNLINFCLYFITLYAFSFIMGKLIRWLIRASRLEAFECFRLENKWYYFFGGHDWKEGDPEGVVIAATIDLAGKGYLYLGVLESFEFDNDGNLDYLIISSAARRCIENDKTSSLNTASKEKSTTSTENETNRFYKIDGHALVLKYAQIKTLNIQYLKIEDVE